MPDWISVKDRLPANEDMQLVACLDKKGRYSINRAWCDAGGYWHGSGSMANVTHWMPLPEPPAEE